MAETPVCVGCGTTDMPVATRRVYGVRGREDGQGTEPSAWACSQQCHIATTMRSLNRQRCVGVACSKYAAPANPAGGRPPEYCEEACRKRTEKALDRALRALARRPKLPEDSKVLRPLLDDLMFLKNCWGGREAVVRECRHFPRPRLEPSGPAYRALVNLISGVSVKLGAVVEHERELTRQREEVEYLQARQKMQAANAQNNNAWQADWLKQAGDGGVPDEFVSTPGWSA